IACTQADACDAAGACAGSPTAECSSVSCSSTQNLGATLDIPLTSIMGSVTLGGQPLPPTNVYGVGTTLFARALDTGAWHQLATFNYTGVSSTLYGPTFTTKLVPGVYDILYTREWDSQYDTVSSTDATDKIPHGL